MDRVLLTDDEMDKAFTNHLADWAMAGYDDRWGDDGMAQDNYGIIRKAQLKKVSEWGDEQCPHRKNWLRRECDSCWQTLLDEVKL